MQWDVFEPSSRGDLGQDARPQKVLLDWEGRFRLYESPPEVEERWIFAFSVTKDWKGKLCKDAKKIIDNQLNPNRIIFVTNQFTNPEKIKGFVNTENYETISYVAPDESFLIYYCIYPEEYFIPGLMISFCEDDGSWSKPVDMKVKLGLKANDLLHASLSPDGKYLFILDDMDIYWIDARIIEDFRNHE